MTVSVKAPTSTTGSIQLNGSDVLTIDSSGITLATGKDLTLSSTALDASASGIYLGGTASANLLDDYEEGTWTPTLSGTSTAGSATYTTQLGGYVKIGKQVIAQCFIHLSGTHTGTGACKVSLPFVASSSSVGYGGATVTYKSNWVGNGPDFMQGEAGVDFGYLRYDNNTTMADLNLATATTTNTTVMLIINYQAA